MNSKKGEKKFQDVFLKLFQDFNFFEFGRSFGKRNIWNREILRTIKILAEHHCDNKFVQIEEKLIIFCWRFLLFSALDLNFDSKCFWSETKCFVSLSRIHSRWSLIFNSKFVLKIYLFCRLYHYFPFGPLVFPNISSWIKSKLFMNV